MLGIGREAVDLFSSNPAGIFDIVLIDLHMSVMDEMETATRQLNLLQSFLEFIKNEK